MKSSRNIIKYFSSCFLCVQVSLAFGQLPPDYRLISVPEGLSHREVRYTTRDARGFLWIINSGIDFYDGQTFTAYSKFDPEHFIPIDNIRTGCKVQDSLLVFTAAKDLYALNLLTRKSHPMPFPEGMRTDFNDIISIVERQHLPNILIITRSDQGMAIHVVDKHWKFLFQYDVANDEFLRTRIVRSFANGPENVIWLLDQANAQVLRIAQDGIASIPYRFEDGLHYRLVYLSEVGLVLCRSDGVVFVLSDGDNAFVEAMRIPLVERVLNPSHISGDGWIWSISDNQLVQFNVRTKEHRIFQTKFFGPYHPILHGSYHDNEGITWINTEVGLLSILPKPKPFSAACTDPDAERNLQFREILPVKPGKVVCRAMGNTGVILELRIDENLRTDTTVLYTDIPRSGLFQRHQNHLYHVASGKNLLLRYALDGRQTERFELPTNATTQFYNLFVIDSTGMIYYQDMENHLRGFHPVTKEVHVIPLESVTQKSPWRVLQFLGKDEILVGTETRGLLFFDRHTGKLLQSIDQQSSPALSGNFVNAVQVESDSILWIGTLGAGLNRLNLTKRSNEIFTKLDGLPDNMIASIEQDNQKNLWVGTYGGLTMYNQTDKRFYSYHTTDGLSDEEFNYLSSGMTEDGIMLMGTLNGVTVFDPLAMISSSPLPPVQLTRIQRYNRKKDEMMTEDNFHGTQQVIHVSPYDNYLDLTFAIPSYTNNTSHTFFSRLKGVEVEWQNLGHKNSVRYQKLPPGNYVLELMAADAHGNKTVTHTRIDIQVHQVFYQSAWFLSLVVISVLGILWAMYRYRLRVLRNEMETRTRIASDLHDEVGGSLTGLYLQMQMMEMQATGQERQKLSKANNIINEAITKMRDLVWSIDARSDSWGKMIERMEDYASDVLSPLDIQMSISHHSLDPQTPIDARTKHNVYLIYKEALHNIAKHSNATRVMVKMEKNSGHLYFTIQDDGTTAERKNGGGQGLQNMQMRAARLKGTLSSGFSENGFRVGLEVPIA